MSQRSHSKRRAVAPAAQLAHQPPTSTAGDDPLAGPPAGPHNDDAQDTYADAPDPNLIAMQDEDSLRQQAHALKRRLQRMHRVLANLSAQKSAGSPPTKLLQQSSSLAQYARLSEVEEEFLIKKTFQSRPQSTELNKSSKLAEYIRSRAGPQFERGRVLVHTVKERQRIAEKAYYDRLFDGSFHNGTLTLEQIVAHSRRTRRENAELARRELEKEERQKRQSRDAPDFSLKHREAGDSADSASAGPLNNTGVPVDLNNAAAAAALRKKEGIAAAADDGAASAHDEQAMDDPVLQTQKKQLDYLDYLDARLCAVDTGNRRGASAVHPFSGVQYGRYRHRSGSRSNSPFARTGTHSTQLVNPRLKKKIAARKLEDEKIKSRLQGPTLHRATLEAEMNEYKSRLFSSEADASRIIMQRSSTEAHPPSHLLISNPAPQRPASEPPTRFLGGTTRQEHAFSGILMTRPASVQYKRRSHSGGGTFGGRVFQRARPSAPTTMGSSNGGFGSGLYGRGGRMAPRPAVARPATAASTRARRPISAAPRGARSQGQSSREKSKRPQTAGILRRISTSDERPGTGGGERAGAHHDPHLRNKPLVATFVTKACLVSNLSPQKQSLAESNKPRRDGPSAREIQAKAQVEQDLHRLMAFFANKIDAKPSAFTSNLDAEVDPLAMMDEEVEDGDDNEASGEGGTDMFQQMFSISGVAGKVMKFAQKLKRKALIASYKKRRMLTKDEYDALRQKSKEFFTDEDGDQVSIDEDMVSMLLDHLETMRPGEGDSGRKKALSRVLLEKARELLDRHDSVAVYAIQQFADNSMMLKLFLRYRLRVDDERKRIVKRRESMAQISSVFKVNSPIAAAGKFSAGLSSPHRREAARRGGSHKDSRCEEGSEEEKEEEVSGLPAGFKASPPREGMMVTVKSPTLQRKTLKKGTRWAVAELLGKERPSGSDSDADEEKEEPPKESKWHAIVRSRLTEISAAYAPEPET